MNDVKKLTKANKRDLAVEELIKTEKSYVDQLRMLDVVYVDALKKLKTITPEQHSTLFSQIKIILNFNTNFLTNLSTAIKQNKSIGQEMLNFCPYFKIYREYVNNYEQASILLRKLKDRPDFTEFDEEGRARCNNLSISDLIVTPIQRVPRYPMLLKEIIKNTDNNHHDLHLLTTALEKYTALNKDINEGIKEQEKRNKVREIGEKLLDGGKPVALVAPARRFIMKGELFKVCRGKNKKYMFFLFNDLLIYADPQGKYFKFHNKLDIDSSFGAEDMEGTKHYPPHSIKITSTTKSFVAFADKQDDCLKWLKALQQLRNQIDNRQKQKGLHGTLDVQKAPIMVPDHFVKACQICKTKFTLIRRRHHCRKCGRVVCGPCSTGRIPDVKDQQIRVCDKCIEQTKSQREVFRPSSMISRADSVKSGSTSSSSDERKEDQPEVSAELFQISFYHGPIEQKLERKEVLKNRPQGSFFMSEADDSLLLVYSTSDIKVEEIKIGMRWTATKTINYICENPRVSSSCLEDLVMQKLWRPLGLSNWVRRTGLKERTADEIKSCPRGVALYDYTAQAPGDLTLKKGDKIIILEQAKAEGWWTGMIGVRTGLFPSTYIEVIKYPIKVVRKVQTVPKSAAPKKGAAKKKATGPKKSAPKKTATVQKKGDIYVGKYDYQQASDQELSFKKGDKIILQRTDDSGWWLGRLQTSKRLGWFPPALVEKFTK